MGRLRGKRNRDQDRYWTIQRRAEQSGMVGAMDVPNCCFCGSLVASVDAFSNDFGDVYCRICGHKRGLVQPIRIRSVADLEMLCAIDAIGDFTDRRGGPGGSAKGHIVGVRLNSPKPTTKEALLRQRLILRAALWLGRDATVASDEVMAEAVTIGDMAIPEARAAIRSLRQVVYRQHHRPRETVQYRKLTDAQAVDIRTRYANGDGSLKSLGREFGVTGATVSFLVSGSTYKTAGGPIHVPRNTPRLGWLCV